MSWARHRNTKRLSYRRRGRFARPPSLEQLGLVRVCDCGGILMRRDDGTFTEACHFCGSSAVHEKYQGKGVPPCPERTD